MRIAAKVDGVPFRFSSPSDAEAFFRSIPEIPPQEAYDALYPNAAKLRAEIDAWLYDDFYEDDYHGDLDLTPSCECGECFPCLMRRSYNDLFMRSMWPGGQGGQRGLAVVDEGGEFDMGKLREIIERD